MTKPFESGVLDPEVHDKLVENVDRIARDANIRKEWIWSPLAETAGPEEIDWVKGFRRHAANGIDGLCYVGRDYATPLETRMAAIAGALLRNFIRARLMTVNQVLDAMQDGATPDMTCLLIPNFFVEKAYGGQQPGWRVNLLLDLLVGRANAGLQTVIYASDLTALGQEYGVALRKHVEAHYRIVEAA